jgi:hypothetical protein
MGTTLMLGSRGRGGFSKTARSHRHPRRHPWQTFAVAARWPRFELVEGQTWDKLAQGCEQYRSKSPVSRHKRALAGGSDRGPT